MNYKCFKRCIHEGGLTYVLLNHTNYTKCQKSEDASLSACRTCYYEQWSSPAREQKLIKKKKEKINKYASPLALATRSACKLKPHAPVSESAPVTECDEVRFLTSTSLLAVRMSRDV